jgi:hypothetical protein
VPKRSGRMLCDVCLARIGSPHTRSDH